MSATLNLDKIAAGEALDSSFDLLAAMREIVPQAEKWIGKRFVLECDVDGWGIAYTHGNNYRDHLMNRGGRRFACAEDAIAALVGLIAKNKGEVEREVAEQTRR